MDHEGYMRQALDLAREAAECGEVPVGCVIVQGDRVVGRGRNRREEKQHTQSHAEMEAIRQANEALGSWRLDEGAVPHVRRGHSQRPDPPGVLRRPGPGDGRLRRRAEPVYGGLSPAARSGGGHTGGGVPGSADGFFSAAAEDLILF